MRKPFTSHRVILVLAEPDGYPSELQMQVIARNERDACTIARRTERAGADWRVLQAYVERDTVAK